MGRASGPTGLLAMVGGGDPPRMTDLNGANAPPPGQRQLTVDNRPTYDIRPENARMFVMKGAGSTSLAGVNPFIIRKAIDGFVGKVESTKKLNSGELLIKVKDARQAKLILKMTNLHTFDVVVSIHSGLNTCKGVITCRDLKSMEEKEIVEFMQDQDVVDAKFITRMRDNVRQRTFSVILTFGKESVPEYVYVGYERLNCRVYVPLPLRCFKCQQFGHGTRNCKSDKDICGKCSLDHATSDCGVGAVPKCVNCSQPHSSYSWECPKYKLEKEIVAYKAKERVDYFEAKKVVLRQLGPASTSKPSYSSALVNRPAVSTSTVSCQTDFYWVQDTAFPSTTPPARTLPVSKPATVSCSTNTVSTAESIDDLALSNPTVSNCSSIVAETTQQLPSIFDIDSTITVPSVSDPSHISLMHDPSEGSSQEASQMDLLAQKPVRERSKSPDDNAAGVRHQSLSPSGGRRSGSNSAKRHKKDKKFSGNHKPQ